MVTAPTAPEVADGAAVGVPVGEGEAVADRLALGRCVGVGVGTTVDSNRGRAR
jgi:hypothetical protein